MTTPDRSTPAPEISFVLPVYNEERRLGQLFDSLIPAGSVPDLVRVDYLARVRDQPAATFIEPVEIGGAVDQLPRAFVRCTTSDFAADLGGDPIEACAARARAEGWPYRELAAPHDPQVFDPDGIAALIEDLAQPT